ncbi:MAG: 7TM diverse intracellular signaling domain-containing protein [Nocardioidaceae bacterium]
MFYYSFYAIALFIASREKYYFYFFIQVIFFFLYGMIYCGDSSQWFPRFALPLTDYGTVIICTGTILVFLFFDALLKTRKKFLTASRLFMISEILLVIAILFYFAGFRSLAATISMLAPSALFVYSIFLCFHLKDEKIIRLFFIGFVVGFAILIFWLLMLRNILPYSPLWNNMLIVQYTLFMITFSIALELNINNYINEKYKAQKELLINLEEKERLVSRQNELLEQKSGRTHS